MNLLDVLGQVLQIFVEIIPRFARRPMSTEYLVLDSMCFGVSIGKRPVLYIPILDQVEYWPRVENPIDPDIQTITTPTGGTVTVRTGFSYTVINPILTRQCWGDEYEARIAMVCRCKVEWWYSSHDVVQDALERDFTISREIKSDLKYYGVELNWFCVEEQSKTPASRIYGIEPIFSRET